MQEMEEEEKGTWKQKEKTMQTGVLNEGRCAVQQGIHAELTEKILKCAFRVQNTLGCGFLEKVYENAMAVALRKEGLKTFQQVSMHVHYQGVQVGEYLADMVVEGAVLVEVKATEQHHGIHVSQVLNYLKATNLPVGLLLNFGSPRLFYRRLELKDT